MPFWFPSNPRLPPSLRINAGLLDPLSPPAWGPLRSALSKQGEQFSCCWCKGAASRVRTNDEERPTAGQQRAPLENHRAPFTKPCDRRTHERREGQARHA